MTTKPTHEEVMARAAARMVQKSQNPVEGMKRIIILAGSEIYQVKYCVDTPYHVSNDFADFLVQVGKARFPNTGE